MKSSEIENLIVATNKTIGTRFEVEFAQLMSECGWWAHLLTQSKEGQPADLIVCRNSFCVLIDCKVCENNRFPLGRLEPNQESGMTMWELRGNYYAYFALKLSDNSIYMIDFDSIMNLMLFGHKSISEEDIRTYPVFIDWVKEMNDASDSRFKN